MTNKKCPCMNCISLAICRHKRYNQLFNDCILLRIYEPNETHISKRNDKGIYLLQEILNPTMWAYKVDEKRILPDIQGDYSLVYNKTYVKDGMPPILTLDFEDGG